MIVELRVSHWMKIWVFLGLSGWFSHYIIFINNIMVASSKNALNPLYNFNIIKVVFVSSGMMFYVLIEKMF